jgi:bifunctional DNA-binding transcriptional regulator/antitoxin component of YhaV-PrlF toxin-antitoxin module
MSTSAHRSFRGVLRSADRGGFVVEVPFDVKEVFGSARSPVTVTVKDVTWRTTVATYGGRYYVGIRRELREKAGIHEGDTISMTVESDDAPRTLAVPAELKIALTASPSAKKNFDALSFTHQKEYVEWITGAKKEETRLRRVGKAVAMLEEGKKTP